MDYFLINFFDVNKAMVEKKIPDLEKLKSFYLGTRHRMIRTEILKVKLAKGISILQKINYLKLGLVFCFWFSFGSTFSQTLITRTFESGAIIIDMGVQPQTVGNGLKPYGLLYALLSQKTPVYWSINPTKVKDGEDFAIGSRSFKGGPFIIEKKFLSASVLAIISTWQSQGVITYTTTAPITVSIYTRLLNVPRWTLDQQNGKIAIPFFTNAGIPATAYGGSSSTNWKLPANLNCCDDVFVMPHADPIWLTHRRLFSWNEECKGAIWLGCHAGSALELMYDNLTTDGDPIDYNEQTNFLANKTGPAAGTGTWSTPNNTVTIWGSHSAGTPPYTYDFPTDPVMQFMGILDGATQNGSEQIYIPRSAGWWPTTKVGVYDPDHPQRVGTATNPGIYEDPKHRPAILAYGRGFGDPNRGFVMLEASHNIAGTSTANVAAQRAFFNFSFLASTDKASVPVISLPPSPLYSGEEYPVSVSFVSGKEPSGSYTVEWSSSCGGTFLPNANSQNATFVPPTAPTPINCTITVTITDNCSRVSFDSESELIQCNIQVSPSVTNACFGSPTGAINYSLTGGGTGTPSYSWVRSSGGTGSGTGTNIPNLIPGTYTVTATGSNGCIISFTSTISQSPEIILSATPTLVSCNGGNNGAIDVTVTGGTPGYTYSWADGPTTANRSELVAGTYTLDVTDSKGCIASTSVTISQPAAIAITPTLTDVTCFGENNGVINLAVTGGTPDYSFLWNDGSTDQNRTGLALGTYSVTVTDANDCTATLTDLTISQPEAALSLSATQVNVLCFGQSTGSIDLTVTGGTATYTYAWTKTGGGYSASTEDIGTLAVGTYNVTVTDVQGCTATLVVTITEPSVLALSTTITHPTCPPDAEQNGLDGTIDLTVAGGVGPYTYVWTAPAATPLGVIPSGQANLQDLTGLQHGTYQVTVTDANGCTATATLVLVAQNDKPVSPPVIKN